MCFSFESSITAWTVSSLIALYLIYRNRGFDRWHASFILIVALVQLWEGIIWKRGPHTNNQLPLQLILITLFAQPLVQSYSGYQYTKNSILMYASILYLAIFIYAVYRATQENFTAEIGATGHLIWKSTTNSFMGPTPLVILYLIGLGFPLLFILPQSALLLLAGVGTLLWSMWRTTSAEVGSYWCYIAVIYSFAALLS